MSCTTTRSDVLAVCPMGTGFWWAGWEGEPCLWPSAVRRGLDLLCIPAYSFHASIAAGWYLEARLSHHLQAKNEGDSDAPYVSCLSPALAAGSDNSLVLAGRHTYSQMGPRRQGQLPINRLRGTRGAAHSPLCTPSAHKLPRSQVVE